MGRLTRRIKAVRQRHRERQRGDRPLFHLPKSQDDEITDERLAEAKRQGLLARISAMFGEDVAGQNIMIREGRQAPSGTAGGVPGQDSPAMTYNIAAQSGNPARMQFATEERDLSGALRGSYSDELRRKYADAERALRFGAANTGNVGSTTYADELSRINEENQRGGLSTSEAIQRALQGLRTSREEVRARATGLVNAGLGEEGVRAAESGLKSAAETARAANRERLFDELFQNLAYTHVGENEANRRNQASNYVRSFWSQPSSSGTIYR